MGTADHEGTEPGLNHGKSHYWKQTEYNEAGMQIVFLTDISLDIDSNQL